jgi:rod shape-determining protein MreC
MPTRISAHKLFSPWSAVVMMVIILVLFEITGMVVVIRSLGEQLVRPVLVISSQVVSVVSSPVWWIRDAHQSHQKIQDLEFRYTQSLAKLGELRSLQEENQALRQLVENTDRTLADSLIAAPITSYGAPLINVGSQRQVAVGDPVLIDQILVGRVRAVSPNQSEVTLLSQVNSGVILAQTETGVAGVAKGDGRRIILTEVPSDQALSVGELVVTSGQDGIAPDIVIGTVAQVRDEPSAPTQTAIITQLVSFYESRIVEVRRQ